MAHEAREPAGGARRVILLEDDAAQRDLLLELFADEGIVVEVCATLADSRAALGRHPRSIVVADGVDKLTGGCPRESASKRCQPALTET